MLPINNSDTAWLIVCDYNQDNDLPYEDLKEDILNPNVNCWCWEYKSFGVGGGGDVGVVDYVGGVNYSYVGSGVYGVGYGTYGVGEE